MMNSKNHYDDLDKKRRFCNVNIAKLPENDHFSSTFTKVHDIQKCDILKKCQKMGCFADKLYFGMELRFEEKVKILMCTFDYLGSPSLKRRGWTIAVAMVG